MGLDDHVDFGGWDDDYDEDPPEGQKGSTMRRRREEEYEDVGDAKIKKRTAKAVLCVFEAHDPPRERWVPLGQARDPDDLQEGETVTLWVTEWFAGKIWDESDGPARQEKAWVEVPGAVVLRETDKAIQVRIGGDAPAVWFPLTQVAEDSEVRHDGDSGVLKISEWIASEKGIGGGAGRQEELPGAGRRPAGEKERLAGDEARQADGDVEDGGDLPF